MKKTNLILTLMFSILLFGSLFIILTSCSKDLNTTTQTPTQTKSVKLQIITDGLFIKKMKSLDLNNWAYEYNPNKYNLVFTGLNNTYTFSESINDLMNSFEISIQPDTYTITYQTTLTPEAGNIFSKYLDIEINEVKTVTANSSKSDLRLTAKNTDYLVLFDAPILAGSTPIIQINGVDYQAFSFTYDANKLFYFYYNELSKITIIYSRFDGSQIMKEITPEINNIYHITGNIQGYESINILPFNVNELTW